MTHKHSAVLIGHALPSHHQRCFLLLLLAQIQRPKEHEESENQRRWNSQSVLNGMSLSEPSPKAQGNSTEEDAERVYELEGMENAKETRPSTHNIPGVHIKWSSMHRTCKSLHQMGS